MAAIVETRVEVVLRVFRDGANLRLIAVARSFTADDVMVRKTERDITNTLTAQQLNGLMNLMEDCENKVKTLWEIS